MRIRRILRICALCCLIALLYLAPFIHEVYSLREPVRSLPATGNGIWLGHRWLAEELEPGALELLGSRCRTSGLTNLFIHAGPVDAQGKIPPFDEARWRVRVARLRKLVPGCRVLAWLGALNSDFVGPAPDTLDLTKPGNLQSSVQGLLQADFDGIHFDIEPVADEDPAFLLLLEETRRTLRGQFLSVAAPQLQPPGLPSLLPGMSRLWSPAYAAQVGARCNQVILMAYDTFQPTSEMFSRYVAYQARTLRSVVPGELLIGVPSYEDNWPYHNPRAETLEAGLRGARHSGADGVALYAEWTTDPREWGVLERELRKADPVPGGPSTPSGSTLSVTEAHPRLAVLSALLQEINTASARSFAGNYRAPGFEPDRGRISNLHCSPAPRWPPDGSNRCSDPPGVRTGPLEASGDGS